MTLPACLALRPAADPTPAASRRIIIKLKNPTFDLSDRAALAGLFANARAKAVYLHAISDGAHVLLLTGLMDDATFDADLAAISAHPDVLYVEPDHAVRPAKPQ